MYLIISRPTNTDAEDTVIEIADLTEEQDQKFAEALYDAEKNGDEIVMSFEDDAGARLGVRGVLYDSEA